MSKTEDHDWCWDHLVPYMAGALSVDECARLETHVAECQSCTREFKDLSTLTSSMWDLFSDARPAEDLEERVIEALRASPTVKHVSKAARVGVSIAALFFVGIVGFVFMGIQDQPGEDVFAKVSTAMVATMDTTRSGAPRPAASPAPPPPPSADDMANRRLTGATFTLDHDAHAHVVPEKSTNLSRSGFAYAGEAEQLQKSLRRNESRKDLSRGRSGGKSYYTFKGNAPAPVPEKLAMAEAESSDLYFKPGAVGGATAAIAARRRFGRRMQDKKKSPSPKPEPKPSRPAVDAAPDEQAPQEPPPIKRRIIRNGEMEFEVESFDPAVAVIEKIAREEQGFVATVNSEKLPNGKVRGSVVVRVPPDRLDSMVLKLRALGELKRRRISSQDVTKRYTDLESRLRAARTMETRLLKIIAEGKGEIKDLVAAEKELGAWRTKIETSEGEKRYYDNLIGMSTLTVTLQEKEIQAPSEIHVTEQVTMGIEVEKVEESHRAALNAIKEARGRVTKSEFKQHAAGQLQALVNFEVAPTSAGPLRDLLKQLGVVARLDVQRLQQTQGGRGRPLQPKIVEKDTRFYLSLYNVANLTPREKVFVNLACVDAEAAYKAILSRVSDAGGRVIKSDLNRQKNDQTQGTIDFEVKSADADAVLQDVRAAGEVMSLQVQEADDRTNVTKSKRGFYCRLFALGSVAPRETTTVQLAVRSVPVAYRTLLEAIRKAQGRVLRAQLNESDRRNVTAILDFDVRREHEQSIADALDAAGDSYSRNSSRAEDSQNVVDSKIRMTLTLLDKENIPPKEMITLAVTVADVDAAVASVEKLAAETGGRVIDAKHNRPADGRNTSTLSLQVPLKSGRPAADRIQGLGDVRVFDASRNDQVPEGDLATVRLNVTLSSEVILPADAGPMANIKRGLQISLQAGSFGLMLVMIGVCLVLPIGVVAWGGWKIYRKINPKTA